MGLRKKRRRNNTYFSFGHLKSRELSYAICTMLRVKLLKSSSHETKRIKLASKYLVELEISLTGNKMTKIGYLKSSTRRINELNNAKSIIRVIWVIS